MQIDQNATSALIAGLILVMGKLLDWLITSRKLRNNARTPTSWQEAYEDISEKYLKLQGRMDALSARLEGWMFAVHQEPYDVALRISERAAKRTQELQRARLQRLERRPWMARRERQERKNSNAG